MTRLVSFAAAVSVLAVAAPALAADYRAYPDLRPAYPDEWQYSDANPLRFEAGLRYWYSWGGQDLGFATGDLESRDITHILEAHGRIEDLSTQTYVKTQAGLGIATNGDYTYNGLDGDITRGTIGYAGGDFGWLPFGNMRDGFALGALVGYQYWKDSPDVGRGNFVTSVDASGTPNGGDSAVHNLDIHALRLGLAATADINDMVDIRAEAAAVPYAYISGTLGPHTFNVPGAVYKSSATSLEGYGYGAMGELMVGFHPTDHLTLRVGGRAWYLQGELDATYENITVTDDDGDPTTDPAIGEQALIEESDWTSLFRYGALVELTGRF